MTGKKKLNVKWIVMTALFLAMNVIFSSSVFSITVPGGHLYLNDIIICIAAILLDPLAAFAVGGIGAFLGDMLFYPAPMFVSLITHGIQAVVVSLCCRRLFKDKKHEMIGAIIGVVLGAIINVVGYSLGRAFLYSTPEYAYLKLPFQCIQASIGSIASVILCYPCGLKKLYNKFGK